MPPSTPSGAGVTPLAIGRNDPCPCGSGKKYKKCCLGLDRAAGTAGGDRLLPSEARPFIAAAEEWEADVIPMPARIQGDPAARPGTVLVLAGGFVIGNEVLERPSPEAEPLAELLASGIAGAAELAGTWPRRVRVRHPYVLEPLRRRLNGIWPDGLRAPGLSAGSLPTLDDIAFSLTDSMVGQRPWYHLSCPEAWAGWDLPGELVEGLFRAAAGFYRAAPWTALGNLDLFDAATPSGRRWTVCVLGYGGEVFGINLYSEERDFWQLLDIEEARKAGALAGRVIALHLEPGRDVGRAMVRVASSAGWEVADARAYPRLLTINSPAGGLLRADAEDLLALLEAVPRFRQAEDRAIEEARPVEGWRDEATGLVLSFRPDTPGAGLVEETERLEPGGPEGPGAEPEAALAAIRRADTDPDALRRAEQRIAVGFARHLAEAKGLSEATVEKHASTADLFLDFLCGYQGVPVRAVHEYDLRLFLTDWYPRKVVAQPSASRAVPGSLERFFAYLGAVEGIVCPWARAILAGERDAFAERIESVPGHFFWDEGVAEWRGQAADRLFARILIPDGGLGGGETWGTEMGTTEANLRMQLERRWLLWRDELIRSGRDRPAELVNTLIERQRGWETTPLADLDGKTPVEAILEERRKTAERLVRSAPGGAPEKGKRTKKSGRGARCQGAR